MKVRGCFSSVEKETYGIVYLVDNIGRLRACCSQACYKSMTSHKPKKKEKLDPFETGEINIK